MMIDHLKGAYSRFVPLNIRNHVFHRILKRGCTDPEEIFPEYFKRLMQSRSGALHVAEVGVDKGTTTREILKLMRSGDQLDLYDRDSCSLFLNGIENIPEGASVNCFSCSSKRKDSYAWTLAEGIELDSDGSIKPKYDLVFLDGAHVFDVDAPAAAYLKELVKVGGIIIFSDMTWTVSGSFTMNNRENRASYTAKQFEMPQVELVVSTLVRTDKRFNELESSDPDCSVFCRQAG